MQASAARVAGARGAKMVSSSSAGRRASDMVAVAVSALLAGGLRVEVVKGVDL